MAQQDLCNHSKEEICNALKIIKEICQHNPCSVCPFGHGVNECLLQENTPGDLDIANPESVWRATK